MPTPDLPIRLLLVEGEDDYHVVTQLCRRDQSMPDFTIEPKGGIDKLLAAVREEVSIDDRVALGILIDRDDDEDNRWGELQAELTAAGVTVPERPDPNGTIIPGQPQDLIPRVGVWLMPDNASPGELEDFVRRMIPSDDGVWPRAENYIDGIPQADRRFRDGKALRATLYAWLAAREQPGRMGAAIGAGDLDTDIDLATRFTGWLRALFG